MPTVAAVYLQTFRVQQSTVVQLAGGTIASTACAFVLDDSNVHVNDSISSRTAAGPGPSAADLFVAHRVPVRSKVGGQTRQCL